MADTLKECRISVKLIFLNLISINLNLKLEQLRVFVAVAESGAIAEAAEQNRPHYLCNFNDAEPDRKPDWWQTIRW